MLSFVEPEVGSPCQTVKVAGKQEQADLAVDGMPAVRHWAWVGSGEARARAQAVCEVGSRSRWRINSALADGSRSHGQTGSVEVGASLFGS